MKIKLLGLANVLYISNFILKDILTFLPLKFRLDFKGWMKFPGTSGVLENGGDWGWRWWSKWVWLAWWAGVSEMKEAKLCPTLQQETFQGCSSENAAEGSVWGAVASHLTPVGFGCPWMWLWTPAAADVGHGLSDTVCRCLVLLCKSCWSGLSHFPVGQGQREAEFPF